MTIATIHTHCTDRSYYLQFDSQQEHDSCADMMRQAFPHYLIEQVHPDAPVLFVEHAQDWYVEEQSKRVYR